MAVRHELGACVGDGVMDWKGRETSAMKENMCRLGRKVCVKICGAGVSGKVEGFGGETCGLDVVCGVWIKVEVKGTPGMSGMCPGGEKACVVID